MCSSSDNIVLLVGVWSGRHKSRVERLVVWWSDVTLLNCGVMWWAASLVFSMTFLCDDSERLGRYLLARTLALSSCVQTVSCLHVILVGMCKLDDIQGGPKNLVPFFLYALTLPNINRFSKLFHCQNQEKIFNNKSSKFCRAHNVSDRPAKSVAKDLATPQMCRNTTLWNASVISNNWKQDDFCNNTF